jgi:hypothetical protein
MAAGRQTTVDRHVIRSWADARGGRPVLVHGRAGRDDPGPIRIMFSDVPHNDGETLEEISWEEWFEALDEHGLALLYQEETADGEQSRFNKLVSRERVRQP